MHSWGAQNKKNKKAMWVLRVVRSGWKLSGNHWALSWLIISLGVKHDTWPSSQYEWLLGR